MILKCKDSMRASVACFFIGCIATAACNGADPETAGNAVPAPETTAAAPAAAVPADEALIKGTPPGGLLDWVGDIEAGIQGIAARASEDRSGAQRAALDLYVGRQEFLEMYYGPAGRLNPAGGALAESIMAAESSFHTLVQMLHAQELDGAALAAAEKDLLERYAVVRMEASGADVPAAPPGNAPAAPAGAGS